MRDSKLFKMPRISGGVCLAIHGSPLPCRCSENIPQEEVDEMLSSGHGMAIAHTNSQELGLSA